jgi:Lrp/AsnC family transcriptional regulator
VALLDRDKFNSSLFIFATLKIGSLTEEDREKFKRKVELTPEILECYAIFGERDVMIKVIAPTIDWYQRFVFSTVLKLPGVVDIQSIVTLNEMKYSTALPVRALQNVQ